MTEKLKNRYTFAVQPEWRNGIIACYLAKINVKYYYKKKNPTYILWQVYNIFPWLFKWIANRKEMHRLAAVNKEQNLEMMNHLRETLNPQMCRGFVDAFLVRKQNLEVGNHIHQNWHFGLRPIAVMNYQLSV